MSKVASPPPPEGSNLPLPDTTVAFGLGDDIPDIKSVVFLSSSNIDHSKFLIVPLSAIGREFAQLGQNLTERAYRKLEASIASRTNAILMNVRYGAIAAIILDTTIPDLTYTTTRRMSVPLSHFSLFNLASYTPKSGDRVELALQEEIPILRSVLDKLRYELTLEHVEPVFVAPSLTHPSIVGGYIVPPDSKGAVFFVPAIRKQAFLRAYLSEIYDLGSKRMGGSKKDAIPDWLSRIYLADERDIFTRIISDAAKRDALAATVRQLEADLGEREWLKRILFETGRALEDSTARLFSEMEMVSARGPEGRADLFVRMDAQLLVCEIKGTDGAAKEWYVNQCSSWVQEVRAVLEAPLEDLSPQQIEYRDSIAELGFEELPSSTLVKGLLVVGTYRETPLEKRNGEDFSAAMKSKLEAASIGAITTLQLLCLFDMYRQPGSDPGLSTKLGESVGVIEIAPDWKHRLDLAS
jgi:hypothetical protein